MPPRQVTEAWDICIAMDPEVNGDQPMHLNPMELFGFGLGDFEIVDVDDADNDPDAKLCFNIATDTSSIVWAPHDTDKEFMPIAKAIGKALVEHNVDDAGVQFHELTPKPSNDTPDVNMRLRYNIATGPKTTVFTPIAVGDMGTEIKHAQLGAVLAGHFKILENTNAASLVWEMALATTSPQQFKPIKPKYWLTVNTTIQPGKTYFNY